MSDRPIQRALTVSILLGLLLGGLWGVTRYEGGLVDARSWNLMGLGVIFTVAGYAGLYALWMVLRRKSS